MKHRHPTRLLASLLALLLAAAPVLRAGAAAARPSVLLVPYVPLAGVPDALALRATELLAAELKVRDEVRLIPLPAGRSEAPGAGKAEAEAARALASARTALARAAEQGKRGRHEAAAEQVQKALAQLTARPLSVGEQGGALLGDGEVLLAVERLLAGDEDGSDAALGALVRLSPERQLSPADYPPAFLRELEAVRKRVLAAPRGSLRVHAPSGPGEARVLLDGRPLRAAPVLFTNVLPGEHFVRVERAGEVWAQRIIVIAGVESPVVPQLGQGGAPGELSAALGQGVLDRAAAARAARLAKAAGAQAAVLGVVVNSAEVVSLRSFLVRGERVVALPPVSLDREMLGASLQMLRLADDIQAQLTGPTAEQAALPIALGMPGSGPQAKMAEVPVAPPPPEGMVAAQSTPEPERTSGEPPAQPESADGTERRVAIPGAKPAPATPGPSAPAPQAPVEAAPEALAQRPAPAERSEPSRNLVVPRQRSAEGEAQADAPPPVTSERAKIAAPAPQRLEALEPESIKSVREPEQKKNHALLWIITGVLVAGGLAAGGVYLYENGRTPSTATVSASWAH